ncbi:MAG: fasciclin domain-containing protein [bacterium]|nr:fasciclin domain-containing protein [bacterium]
MRKLGLSMLLLAALALMAGLGGCSSNDAGLTGPAMPQADTKGGDGDLAGARTTGGSDIVDTAIGAGSFTTLVAAVQAAGLEGALRGEGPFTVFAPTDDAFAALPEGFVAQLLQPRNQGKLQELLLYHVVSGEVFSRQLRPVQFVPTLADKYLWVRKFWNRTVKVNNATVIAADVDASNGVIHVIDKVLVPVGFELVPEESTSDIVETAIAAGAFNTLVAAASAADLVGALQGDGPLTVFAPTDDAFSRLPAGLVEALLLPENKGKLQELLLYHVVEGRVLKSDLSFYQRVPTLQGSQVSIVKWFGNVWVNTSKVTTADVLATNGVIHVIDRVLIPRGFRLDSKAGSFTADSIEKAMPLGDDAELPPTEFPAEYQDQAL